MEIHRLQSTKDIRALFRLGRHRESSFFRITTRRNTLLYSRFAFIAPKTINKKAVVRNRLRRRAREWIRMHVAASSYSFDVALTFKKTGVTATKNQFYEDIATLFR